MKISNYVKNPKKIILLFMSKGLFNFLDDTTYLKLQFYLKMGQRLNLQSPQTYNEKIQWLKLYDRKKIYTTMVDKYEAKKYVANLIGENYIIPTIGIYNYFEEIDFDTLPNQFVIKCTHDSGGLIICRDKTKLNINEVQKTINHYLNRNYYNSGREWPYKDVKPRIIIEQYMEDKHSKSLKDFKFYCFNGEPKYLYVSEGLENHKTARMEFFDMGFNSAPFAREDYKTFESKPKKPIHFEKMKELSRILSKGIPFLRVDFYEINGVIYFGELTFSPCSGYMKVHPKEYDKILGDMLILPMEEGDSYEKKDMLSD